MPHLYYWTGPDVLPCYSGGICAVMADSPAQARIRARNALLIDRLNEMPLGWLSDWDEDYQTELEEKLTFLKREPSIAQDMCVYQSGSD